MSSPTKRGILAMPPEIPSRISSKRALEDDLEQHREARKKVDKDIEKAQKKIKARASFDADYWYSHRVVSDKQLERHAIVKKISMVEFQLEGGTEEDWESQETAAELREKKSSLELRRKLFSEQMSRLGFYGKTQDEEHRQWIMELITSLPREKGGIGAAGNVGGARDAEDQKAFRKALIKVCQSEDSTKNSTRLWCPILGANQDGKHVVAAHIFPYAAGQLSMDKLFGRPDGEAELMAPANGLMMCSDAEKRFDMGWMALVPDLPTNATKEQEKGWAEASVRGYKIRVLNARVKQMTELLPVGSPLDPQSGRDRSWWELDGQRVAFSSDHRPRARYLYWAFAVALMRYAYQSKHSEHQPLTAEFGKRFWGTGGPWIRRKYLRGFAEYLGHDFKWDNLMEAAMDPEDTDDEVDPAGVIMADKELERTRVKMEEGWMEEQDKDEEWEEEEEEEGEQSDNGDV
ncbi:MAG: hypothetical protein Q9219_004036 [cf. Caloplaca sp. 3 TL-2023]